VHVHVWAGVGRRRRPSNGVVTCVRTGGDAFAGGVHTNGGKISKVNATSRTLAEPLDPPPHLGVPSAGRVACHAARPVDVAMQHPEHSHPSARNSWHSGSPGPKRRSQHVAAASSAEGQGAAQLGSEAIVADGALSPSAAVTLSGSPVATSTTLTLAPSHPNPEASCSTSVWAPGDTHRDTE
jgi:hypothetical protein